MKKILCAMIGLCTVFTAGCANKSDNAADDNITETTAAENTTEADTEPTTEPGSYEPLATVRDRNIVKADDFSYEIYEGSVIITKYNGNSADVEIPAEIEGAPVTQIGFYAFEAKYDLQSVVLPETITVIGEGAFMDCPSLSSINLPDGLKEIERGAFGACVNIPALTIPASVTRIYEQAFTFCDGLTSLTILNPDLKYESWGLEELPQLTVYAQEGSAAAQWAAEMGKFAPL